jgi:hypothetical protein
MNSSSVPVSLRSFFDRGNPSITVQPQKKSRPKTVLDQIVLYEQQSQRHRMFNEIWKSIEGEKSRERINALRAGPEKKMKSILGRFPPGR